MRVVACDLGGTNVRFGLGIDGRLEAETIQQFPNDRFADFGDALGYYLQSVGVRTVDRAVIAVAAPIEGETLKLTNRDWTVNRAGIAAVAGTNYIVLVNDFAALGAALLQPEELDVAPVLAAIPTDGAKLVLGAGTGFNASALVGKGQVLSAEIGHTTFAPEHGLETALRDHIAGRFGRCSLDRALSGSGLVTLYEVQCARCSRPAIFPDASAITSAALAGDDADAIEAGRTFAGMLGRTAGDLALTFLPRGGIYLTGGVTRALTPFIEDTDGPFARAFFAKGRMGELMRSFPLGIIRDDKAALIGCLAWPDLATNAGSGVSAAEPI